MAWTLKNYQRGGDVDTQGLADKRIIALAHHIATKAGMPNVRRQYTPGAYAHRQGLAVDIQPGRGNQEGMRALRDAVLALDWDKIGIRYMAALGMEYGGSWGGKGRARKQAVPYVGTDPWHQNHVHVDIKPSAPVVDYRDIKPGTTQRVLDMLAALDYADVRTAQRDLGLVVDGYAGPLTTEALEAEMSKLDVLATEVDKIKQAVGRMEPIVRALGGAPATGDVDAATIEQIRKRSEQTNAAVGRIEKAIGTYGQAKGN